MLFKPASPDAGFFSPGDKPLDQSKTRAILAYFWSVVSSIFLGYILVYWGDQKEILTLIIGLIGGTVIGGIFGVFFGGDPTSGKTPNKHGPSTGEVLTDGDTIKVTKEAEGPPP